MVQIMVNDKKKIGAVDVRSVMPQSESLECNSDSITLYRKEHDLAPGYWFGKEAAVYLNSTERKISLYRRYGLLKYAKFGKNYVYRKSWLDDFAEAWSGYDLSNEQKVKCAIAEKKWRKAHGMGY